MLNSGNERIQKYFNLRIPVWMNEFLERTSRETGISQAQLLRIGIWLLKESLEEKGSLDTLYLDMLKSGEMVE